MIETLMWCGIGLLAGCLLSLMFVTRVHDRAVRLATRKLAEAMPMTAKEIRAEKDLLRARFTTAARQLEVNVDELRARSAGQLSRIGRNAAEINALRAELDKRAAYILALQARDALRRSIMRRTVKLLLYLFTRSRRKPQLRFGPARSARADIIHALSAAILPVCAPSKAADYPRQ
jgi:hypothetical protein